VALRALSRYTEALECYDEVLEINPQFALAWLNKGWALGALGRYTEALECYDEAIEIDPNYSEA